MITQNENEESQNQIQSEELSSINKNKTLNFPEDNQYSYEKENNQNKSNQQAYQDEEGNLLDPNDLSYNSEEDKASIIIFDMEINFMKNVSQIDVVFLLDTTKSVNPFLKGVKRYIRKLLFDARKSISHYLSDDFDILNYGLVAYRDHDQENIQKSYVSKILCNLNEDYNVFRQALYEVDCAGGDDTCEAVVDGLHEAVNLFSWREDSIKLLYHICGSPCHGSDFNGEKKEGKIFDKFEDGCPCGMDLKNVLKSLRGKNIEYNLIGLDYDLKDMAQKFSDFIKVELLEIDLEPMEGVSGEQIQREIEEEE